MLDSGTTSRGLFRWMRCHSSLYLPPTRCRSGPVRLRAPLEGVVVHELTSHRVVTIAQGFCTEGTDHLRVAVVATLADVDIAPSQAAAAV